MQEHRPADYARERLCLLLSQQGESLLSTTGMLEIMLKRYCQQEPEAAALLMKAVHNGLVHQLRITPPGPKRDVNRGAWLEKMCRKDKMKPVQAQWVLDSWELALSMIDQSQPEAKKVALGKPFVQSHKAFIIVALIGLLIHGVCFGYYYASEEIHQYLSNQARKTGSVLNVKNRFSVFEALAYIKVGKDKAFIFQSQGHGIASALGFAACVPFYFVLSAFFGPKLESDEKPNHWKRLQNLPELWFYASGAVFLTLIFHAHFGLWVAAGVAAGLVVMMKIFLSFQNAFIGGVLFSVQILALLWLHKISFFQKIAVLLG